jgi:hypothetical protein
LFFVFCGCNKVPQSGKFIKKINLVHIVLEAGMFLVKRPASGRALLLYHLMGGGMGGRRARELRVSKQEGVNLVLGKT